MPDLSLETLIPKFMKIESRNEEVERVKRLRETRLIIFGLIGFIRFLVKSPVII